jgi:hypothetical protein
MAGILKKHSLVDAFENQRDKARGRDAVGRERFTQYNHGNRGEGFGQRIDLVMTNMPLEESKHGEAVIVRVTVLSEENCGDHVPVETEIEFAAVEATGHTGISMPMSLGGEKTRASKPRDQEARSWEMGARVLVSRQELTAVAASPCRLWVPATVKTVIGQLVRVRVDKGWLVQGVRQEQGVTAQGLKVLEQENCPTRYVLGEGIVHSKSGKRGVIVEIAEGEGTPRTHEYGVVFDGTVVQAQRSMGTLRPTGKVDDLTGSLKTGRDLFETIASCMATEN